MRLSSRRVERRRRIELSMTSMIDVVFLLLIFFMSTSAFVRPERELDPAIQARRRAAAAASDLEPAIVDVVVRDGRGVFRLGEWEAASEQELLRVLRAFPNKADGAVVRVSDAAPFQMAAAAVHACKAAGFPAVSYVPLDASLGGGERDG